MYQPPTVYLIVASVLLCILYYRLVMHRLDSEGRQIRSKGLRQPSMPIHSSLFTKVGNVRHDLEAPHNSNKSPVRKSRRLMLIAAARGAIRSLPFFHSREHEHGT